MHPAFNIPGISIFDHHLISSTELILFVPFGLLIGVASALFIHSIYWFEDKFELLPLPYYLRHVIGMLILGLMLI